MVTQARKPTWVEICLIGAFALMQALPLFRPLLIESNRIHVVYGFFVVAASAFAVLIFRIYGARFTVLDYLAHAFFLIFAFTSTLGAMSLPWGKALLSAFLYLSYMFGRWIGQVGGLKYVGIVIGSVFIPVAIYVSYQLAINNFTYSTYYRWSDAMLKLDYLEYALFGVMLYVLLQDAKVKFSYKLVLLPCLFAAIVTSGARYSILFLVIAILLKISRLFWTGRTMDRAVLIAFGIAAIIVLAVPSGRISGKFEALNYTTTRLISMANNDASIGARFRVLGESLEALGASPWVGYGLGGGAAVVGINYPHNVVVEVALDSGVISGVLLFLLLGGVVLVALHTMRRGDFALGAITLYLIGAYLKSFSFYESRILFLFIGISIGAHSASAFRPRALISHGSLLPNGSLNAPDLQTESGPISSLKSRKDWSGT